MTQENFKNLFDNTVKMDAYTRQLENLLDGVSR